MCSQPPSWLEAGTGEEQVSESKAEVAPLLLTHPFQPQRARPERGSLSVGFSCFYLPAGRSGRCPGIGTLVWRGPACTPVWHSVGAGLLLQEGAGRRDGTAPPLPHRQKLWTTEGSAISLSTFKCLLSP